MNGGDPVYPEFKGTVVRAREIMDTLDNDDHPPEATEVARLEEEWASLASRTHSILKMRKILSAEIIYLRSESFSNFSVIFSFVFLVTAPAVGQTESTNKRSHWKSCWSLSVKCGAN